MHMWLYDLTWRLFTELYSFGSNHKWFLSGSCQRGVGDCHIKFLYQIMYRMVKASSFYDTVTYFILWNITFILHFILCKGSDSLPGNYGLLDQVAALQWVRKNIAQFGGDSRRVTLGAERNGADIASLHLTSSSSSGLFLRALLMVRYLPLITPPPSESQQKLFLNCQSIFLLLRN